MTSIEFQEDHCDQRLADLRMQWKLPQDPPLTFSDLIGKLGMLRVECGKCGFTGSYSVCYLARQCRRKQTILDWKDQLTADCPRRVKGDYDDQCSARCPDLLKII